MLYKIKQILHTGTCGDFGTERTDGRYPKRIGRVVEIDSNKLQVDRSMVIRYVRESDGTPIEGLYLFTSYIISISENINKLKVTTLNSIYIFERVQEDGKFL